ncbi:hypothetical protein [Gordonia westfalica]|nr:hypothetical protein [Gordonia westfalica]
MGIFGHYVLHRNRDGLAADGGAHRGTSLYETVNRKPLHRFADG